MSEVLLEVKNVSKRYGHNMALQNVSFDIGADRIVGLLGPNGSGKTTLIKIVNALLADYEGHVSVCGHRPGKESKKLVSYLPDKMALPTWLTVSEALDLYNKFFTDFQLTRAHGLLDTLKVAQNKRIGELSKGMQEKLMLVLTMARRAKLYVLDEPIAGVDPAARDLILSTILDNFTEGSSILLSTHIISDVETIFDDVIFLKEGQVNLLGEAETLRSQYGKSIDQLFREVFKC
ncbi:MAG: ABC transporter ATP-binding protein [Firmicutes bacterium]|nr:ABC transporter ATP-binding protein [Bacillota bacterium]